MSTLKDTCIGSTLKCLLNYLKVNIQYLLLIGTVLKFNIINLLRYDSFYRNGLVPMVYSESHPGWHRDNGCFDITYSESDPELFVINKQNTQPAKPKHNKRKS